MDRSPPRMMFNDDGWIMGTYGPPLTPDIMREKMITPYAGSPVDVFLWSVGGHEVYDFETDIGERCGDGYSEEELGEQMCRRRDNLRYLCDSHGGPVTVISQLCREAGIRFFPSVRMNEHYDIDEAAPNYGRLRRQRPELLIGTPDEVIPPGTLEWGIRTGLNYAFDDVRTHMLRIIFELIERFEIDGIELDFMRHPAFFRVEEAFTQRYLVTDLVRQVRHKLDEAGRLRRCHLDLAIRVPPTLHDCLRIGLDVERWMREGLADILIAGGGFIPFAMPMAMFVDVAGGSGCRVFGCFEGLRPLLDRETMRAVAARYWDQGVDGLYFFNYYSMDNAWKREVLSELTDSSRLLGTNKQYQVDRSGRFQPTSQLGFSFLNAIPRVQLPSWLRKTPAGRGLQLYLSIVDDLSAVIPQKCILGLSFDGEVGDRTVSLSINGTDIDWNCGGMNPRVATHYDADWNEYPSKLREICVEDEVQMEFDVAPSVLASGQNVVELTLLHGEPIWVVGAQLSIGY